MEEATRDGEVDECELMHGQEYSSPRRVSAAREECEGVSAKHRDVVLAAIIAPRARGRIARSEARRVR